MTIVSGFRLGSLIQGLGMELESPYRVDNICNTYNMNICVKLWNEETLAQAVDLRIHFFI